MIEVKGVETRDVQVSVNPKDVVGNLLKYELSKFVLSEGCEKSYSRSYIVLEDNGNIIEKFVKDGYYTPHGTTDDILVHTKDITGQFDQDYIEYLAGLKKVQSWLSK